MRTWRRDGDPATKTEEFFFDYGDTLPTGFNVDFKDVEVGEKIGKGIWTVHKAKWLGRDVAVKKFNCDSTFGNVSLTFKEVNCMLSLRHPNTMKLLGFYLSIQSDMGFYLSIQSGIILQCTMIMELMDCDLEEYLEKGLLSDDHVVYILAKVAREMKRIHERGCFHQDLKSKNVLLRESRVTGFNVDVKIADFGSCELVSYGHRDRTAGTFGYKAPEQFDPKPKMRQDKVDAFGFGALCFKVLTGNKPYEMRTNVRETVEKIDRASICKQNLLEDVVEVIWKCLDTDREARPNFERILSILDGALTDIWEKMSQTLASSSSTSFQLEVSMWKGAKGKDRWESILHNRRLSWKYGVNFIPVEELFVLGLIAQGAYGPVFKVEWKGVWYAQKVWREWCDEDNIYLPLSSNGTIFDDFHFQTNPKLFHKNIVTFMGYSIAYGKLSMIIELQAMDLASVLESDKFGGRESILNDNQRLTIMSKIAKGMKYLHDQGIVHGDLHAGNVVLSTLDTNDMIVKLIDFASEPQIWTPLYPSLYLPKDSTNRVMWVKKDLYARRAMDVCKFGTLCLKILGRIPHLFPCLNSNVGGLYSQSGHQKAIAMREKPQMPMGTS